MALVCKFVATVTTASASDCERLFHGMLAGHVGSFRQDGIDFTKGGGYFWATPDLELARYFAGLAEQQLLFTGGIPGQAVLAFDVPKVLLNSFQAQQPEPWLVAYSQGYRFGQACSADLHKEMKNIEITYEEG